MNEEAYQVLLTQGKLLELISVSFDGAGIMTNVYRCSSKTSGRRAASFSASQVQELIQTGNIDIDIQTTMPSERISGKIKKHNKLCKDEMASSVCGPKDWLSFIEQSHY
ncbi:hypothetical protein WA026_022694 [Henosepilachna vigintioctopunctata]|uniref:LAGLIDADG homing endonuclease n=1 Tax=Henosepilachna vigintioctopunctata TaxID=420089 RepID=A0AAW1TPM3_9CUCU